MISKPSPVQRTGMATKIDVTITYLEQRARPDYSQIAKPPGRLAILRAHAPPAHYYRYLYGLIGDPHKWVSRKRLDDEALIAIIQNPDVHIHILYDGGVPTGFSEFDRRDPDDVEIKFFGLAPEATGKGYGKWFLAQTLELAWQYGPSRVRLETCSLDHPAALPLYQKMGFTVFDQRAGVVDLGDASAVED